MDAMSNNELRSALHSYRQFIGVFSADSNPLPYVRSFPCCFIMNTSPIFIADVGHWLAFYFLSPTSLEFFDSLGQPLSSYPNLSTYFSHITHVSSNNLPLQSASSALCGDYCVTFLSLRMSHLTFPHIITLLLNHKGNSREAFVRQVRLLTQSRNK